VSVVKKVAHIHLLLGRPLRRLNRELDGILLVLLYGGLVPNCEAPLSLQGEIRSFPYGESTMVEVMNPATRLSFESRLLRVSIITTVRVVDR
jgi:hypothetical protein